MTRARQTVSGERDDAPSEIERTQVRSPPGHADDAPLGLVVVASPDPALIGAFFAVGPGATAVGRGSDAPVRIDDSGISRLHFRIVAGAGGTYLAEDQGSSNGTWVNGVRVESATLAQGDRIQLGTGTELLFGRREDGASPEVRLRQALGAAGAGAWEWSPDGALTLSGGLARELTTSAETTEPPVEEIWSRIHHDDRAALRARLAEAVRDGGACEVECRFTRRDGTTAWIAMRGEVVRDGAGGGARVAGAAMDVTARKRAEEEMRRQALLLDSLSDGVAAVNFDGTVLDWNARAAQIFGFARAEVVGQSFGALFGCPDDLGAVVVARARVGRHAAEERLLRRKDGSSVAIELVALPLRDHDGRHLACVAVLRDVDERRRMLAQLQVTERLASLGTLAAGVAHEVNNPLAFIGANLGWLRQRLGQMSAQLGDDRDELEKALADSLEGTERIRLIVEDLKTYASGSAASPAWSEASDANAAIGYALRVADGELRRRARVVRDLGEIPRVRLANARLGQVFLNLLLNAAQAITRGDQDENEIRVRSRHDEKAGMVVVEVEDTGSGIPPGQLSRIFDPFFSTKPVGSGTGLGLFICHGIVTEAGGKIDVESRPGAGSTFRVWLPVSEKPAPERS